MKIRAVTLFTDDLASLPNLLDRVNAGISVVSSKYGVSIVTKRVTLPFVNDANAAKEQLRVLKSTAARRGYVYSGLSLMTPLDSSTVVKLINEYDTYSMVWMPEYDDEVVDFYVNLLKLIASEEPLAARKVAILLGDLIETPYYPASVNVKGGTGLSIAILYASDLLEGGDLQRRLRDIVGKANEIGEELSELAGVEYRGIDASLSPWGQDSVVKVIEKVGGLRFGELGTMATIGLINRLITELPFSKTGFNEVMLPLGEDDELKERFNNGLVDLFKLISYTQVCVAGIDMVPVPINELGLIKNLLLDLTEVVRVKGRSLGVRLIPAKGTSIDLGEDFGKSPVVSLLTGKVLK
ncbi:DUF711 family protein [Caldivirga maquilingensis]|uniref:DUF711 family protein n=1 Tax=Caldivirga maquilingensis (strain ATCC 700844 / DSM 13496 / JCM 10307 / IC-167) TaxID=397948 RepID=A8MCM2_CALMQ|nr:DUF711 family protein [Caldivirga maquilingensis]ABW01528.1 protein of unknown function DUF711 [Caldivirga maquilingensis IC-167]